jgi:CheY-like chemotaxis protein
VAEPLHTVIAVDDDPIVLKALARMLRGWGWNVIGIDNPQDLDLRQQGAQVILTDWDMPGGGGPEVLRRALLPVVIYSSSDLRDIREVSGYEVEVIAKPAEAREINAALRRALSGAVCRE